MLKALATARGSGSRSEIKTFFAAEQGCSAAFLTKSAAEQVQFASEATNSDPGFATVGSTWRIRTRNRLLRMRLWQSRMRPGQERRRLDASRTRLWQRRERPGRDGADQGWIDRYFAEVDSATREVAAGKPKAAVEKATFGAG
jgi:hypothetical protein